MFVTLGDDNPVVEAIHIESGVRTDALNKGPAFKPEPVTYASLWCFSQCTSNALTCTEIKG